jgi:hypothetical protein
LEDSLCTSSIFTVPLSLHTFFIFISIYLFVFVLLQVSLPLEKA